MKEESIPRPIQRARRFSFEGVCMCVLVSDFLLSAFFSCAPIHVCLVAGRRIPAVSGSMGDQCVAV